MQKGKKSEVNSQEVNIGTKRTDPSDKQKSRRKKEEIKINFIIIYINRKGA